MFDNLRNTFNFDDLLFAKRNRDYGAYQLRKRYNSVVLASIIIAVLLFSSTIIIPFISKPKNEKVLSAGLGYVSVQMENFAPPEEQLYIPPSAPPPPPAAVQEVVKYVPPVITDSVIPIEETLPTSEQLETISSENEAIMQGGGSGDEFTGEGGGPSDEPFFLVEVMPLFRGGDLNKFRDWVQKRTNYPVEAIQKKIKGRVFLTFIVETDGTVSNVTVVKGVDPLIDAEALKAIEASPKWTPGLQRGQPVRVRYSMWLNFVF